MQRLEVSGAVRLTYRSLGVKGLNAEDNYYFIQRHVLNRLKIMNW
jgi:hypothetical protein